MVYNEEWFLPHFLDHYRSIGIRHFVFYDDESTDSTRELLLAQDDCTVVVSGEGQDVGNGVEIQTSLINGVPLIVGGEGAWSVSVDADELLMLPTRFGSIDDVVSYLEARDLSCVLAPMIDFYPRRLSERFFDPLPLFEGCPWFDHDSPLMRVPEKPQPRMIPAGVRVRLLQRMMREAPEKIDEIYGEEVYRYAKLWKVPLLKNTPEVIRIGPHNVNIRPPENVQLGIAHFKFYPELDRRIEESLARNVHFLGAIEYRFLKAILEMYPDDSLIYRGSRKYTGPADVERAGLMWAE
jgi:hypothetical protein